MPFLVALAEARLNSFNELDLANLMYGLAACGGPPDLAPPSLLAAAEQRAVLMASTLSPQARPFPPACLVACHMASDASPASGCLCITLETGPASGHRCQRQLYRRSFAFFMDV